MCQKSCEVAWRHWYADMSFGHGGIPTAPASPIPHPLESVRPPGSGDVLLSFLSEVVLVSASHLGQHGSVTVANELTRQFMRGLCMAAPLYHMVATGTAPVLMINTPPIALGGCFLTYLI